MTRSSFTLSARGFQRLRYSIEQRGKTLSRVKLLQEVWEYQSVASTRTVGVHVGWLRRKPGGSPKPKWIVTLRRMGCQFMG